MQRLLSGQEHFTRELRFGSQHPNGNLQLSVILFPGYLMSSSGLLGHCMQVLNRHECRQSSNIHKNKYIDESFCPEKPMFRRVNNQAIEQEKTISTEHAEIEWAAAQTFTSTF